MRLGINYPPVPSDINSLLDTKAQSARIVVWQPCAKFVNACLRHNIEVLIVLDATAIGTTYNSWQRTIPALVKRYKDTRIVWQIGNEPDQEGPSSWTMDPSDYQQLLKTAAFYLRGWKMIGAGMASGDPSYLDGLDLSMLSAIGVHPYGQRPDGWPDQTWGFGNTRDLVTSYKRFKLPIIASEFGGEIGLFVDEHERAVYHSMQITTLNMCGVEEADIFCYSDSMVPGFGLVDEQGNPKETYAAFVDAIS